MSDLQPGTDAERGKAVILEHVRDLMATSEVELRLLVFEWEYDPIYHRWVLRIRRGKASYSLTFMERDVVAWPKYPAVPKKYESRIYDLVGRLKAAE